jgi:ELWxxDGT repeat protein
LGLTAIGGSTFALRWLRDSGGISYLLEQSISTDNGATWGAVEIVSNELENSYDPVSLVTSNNEYSLMWRVQNGNPNPFFLKVARYEPSITLPQKELYLAAEMEAGPVGSSPYSAVTYNGKLYYSASTAATGRELFSFDGTNVELVADLNPGSGDGLYSSGGVIGVFNNKLFLKGDDGTTGFELYAYDGTNIELIADVVPGPTSSMAYMPDNLVYFDDLLFFSGQALDISEGRGYVYDFATGSYFQPYVTTIGLYNDANELVAVGKLAQPVPKSRYTDMTFVVKFDS